MGERGTERPPDPRLRGSGGREPEVTKFDLLEERQELYLRGDTSLLFLASTTFYYTENASSFYINPFCKHSHIIPLKPIPLLLGHVFYSCSFSWCTRSILGLHSF